MAFPEPPPPPTEERTTCFYHTDRETGRRCTRCGRPACWECLHDAPVGAHCWECLKQERPPRAEQARRAVRSTAGDPMIVTKTLIGLNVLVFLIAAAKSTNSLGSNVTTFQIRWGLFDGAVAAGQWDRLLTSGFIHFGLLHIGSNMFLLWIVGLLSERWIGRTRFALIYFACLLAGSFGVMLANDRAVGGGASGAVLGIAVAAAIGMWQRGIPFYNTGLGPLVVINVVLTFLISGISIGAHIGGLIAGVILGAVMLHPRVRNPAIGILLAVAMMVGSVFGSVAVARHYWPPCTQAQNHADCTH